MDKKFLEFWGNLLISAAKKQEQIENLQRLATEGFKACEFQMNLFRDFYDLKPMTATPASDDQIWEKAFSDFMKSYQEFIGFLGLVPRKTYDELAQENDHLKKKISDLEKSLRSRRKKTGRQETDPALVVKGLEGLMKKQADQFQTLMTSYGKLYDHIKPSGNSEDVSSEAPVEKG